MTKTQRIISRSTTKTTDNISALPQTTDETPTTLPSFTTDHTTSISNLASSTSKHIPPASQQIIPNTNTTVKTKTKSTSKTKTFDHKNSSKTYGYDSDEEANYDLQTCIQETGGLFQFLNTPCMVLYKNDLQNQGKFNALLNFDNRIIFDINRYLNTFDERNFEAVLTGRHNLICF